MFQEYENLTKFEKIVKGNRRFHDEKLSRRFKKLDRGKLRREKRFRNGTLDSLQSME